MRAKTSIINLIRNLWCTHRVEEGSYKYFSEIVSLKYHHHLSKTLKYFSDKNVSIERRKRYQWTTQRAAQHISLSSFDIFMTLWLPSSVFLLLLPLFIFIQRGLGVSRNLAIHILLCGSSCNKNIENFKVRKIIHAFWAWGNEISFFSLWNEINKKSGS